MQTLGALTRLVHIVSNKNWSLEDLLKPKKVLKHLILCLILRNQRPTKPNIKEPTSPDEAAASVFVTTLGALNAMLERACAAAPAKPAAMSPVGGPAAGAANIQHIDSCYLHYYGSSKQSKFRMVLITPAIYELAKKVSPLNLAPI